MSMWQMNEASFNARVDNDSNSNKESVVIGIIINVQFIDENLHNELL